jgi:hypothetical protein
MKAVTFITFVTFAIVPALLSFGSVSLSLQLNPSVLFMRLHASLAAGIDLTWLTFIGLALSEDRAGMLLLH